MQMVPLPSGESAARLHIYINSSPVQASIIHELLTTDLQTTVLIQCRGMTTQFSGIDREYICHDESLINSRKIVYSIVSELLAYQNNMEYWTIYASHGDSLLARIVFAAGGIIHYVDDGLGTYAALADFFNDGDAFKTLLLQDNRFTKPLLDRRLNYLVKPHWIEGLIYTYLRLSLQISLPLTIIFAAISRNLFKQYFRFDSDSHWRMKLLHNPFILMNNIEKTNISLVSRTIERDRVLILLPPYFQTDPVHFTDFLKAASQICRLKKYKYIYIKLHPADSRTDFPMDISKFFQKKITQIDINSPTDISIWAYNHNFQQVIVFNTSSTFYAKKLIKSDYFIWTDLYEAVTGTKSATDIVYKALAQAGYG